MLNSFSVVKRDWVKSQRLISHVTLLKEIEKPTENSFQHACFIIAMHPKFELIILFVIVLNTATMCLLHYDAKESFNKIQYYSELVFYFIYLFEFVIFLNLYFFLHIRFSIVF